jgi:hypothetical protein
MFELRCSKFQLICSESMTRCLLLPAIRREASAAGEWRGHGRRNETT